MYRTLEGMSATVDILLDEIFWLYGLFASVIYGKILLNFSEDINARNSFFERTEWNQYTIFSFIYAINRLVVHWRFNKIKVSLSVWYYQFNNYIKSKIKDPKQYSKLQFVRITFNA